MLSRPQQILLKRAQAQAGLSDEDYREAIETASGLPGARSSKDPRLADAHMDHLMAYFEAIYWHTWDAGVGRQAPMNAPFRIRGYWADKNRNGNTSRDRFTSASMAEAVKDAEDRLIGLGYGLAYLQSIQHRIGRPFSMAIYLAALRKTLRSKEHATGNGVKPT